MADPDEEAQRQRAIRRAVESTSSIRRPADWRPQDYQRFEDALRANGYRLVARDEERSNG